MTARPTSTTQPTHPPTNHRTHPPPSVRVPLMDCVERTKEVQAAMDKGDFELAVLLRGKLVTVVHDGGFNIYF